MDPRYIDAKEPIRAKQDMERGDALNLGQY